jgi:hypothetical protein
MRIIIAAAIAAVCVVGVARADPAGDALSAKAEACIKSAAPEVSRMSADPTAAVGFLVNDLCAVEVQRAESYASNSRMLGELQATMPPVALEKVSIDPVTGELRTPPGFSAPLNVSSAMLTTLRNLNPRARFAAFAARAILAAHAGGR